MIINSEMKERMNEIRNIENKYGLMLFGMGLCHLVDTGHKHFTDSYVEEGIRQIMAEGEKDAANGVHQIMTPEFQCEILRCAADLAKFSIWTLFAYIKNHMEVSSL